MKVTVHAETVIMAKAMVQTAAGRLGINPNYIERLIGSEYLPQRFVIALEPTELLRQQAIAAVFNDMTHTKVEFVIQKGTPVA